MQSLSTLQAIILGVVEGLTEFLPISSTGHLILTSQWLGVVGESVKVFEIAIQSGAIFAVMLLYWQKIWAVLRGLPHDRAAQHFALLVIVGSIPAVVLGFSLGGWVKQYLFSPIVVASAFIVGGFIILWAERRSANAQAPSQSQSQKRIASVDNLSLRDALKVGLLQCLALIPGTSRSGATIIGGMWLGLPRKVATEYSFFLAMPLLLGAGAYSLYKARAQLSMDDLGALGIGTVAAFISAWLCIRWLLKFVSSHTFHGFAYYRIVFGGFVLLSHYAGWIRWAA